MGVNHIGLSVKDLDRTLAFYQNVSGFELVSRQSVGNSDAADQLFGVEGVAYEIAVLEAPNMLFEFIEFEHNADKPLRKMPVNGPGMTHTRFQSASNDSGMKISATPARPFSHTATSRLILVWSLMPTARP